jgi:hypothetical protein
LKWGSADSGSIGAEMNSAAAIVRTSNGKVRIGNIVGAIDVSP